MARGWESKSIESQQEDRESAAVSTRKRDLTPAEKVRLERRTSIELALARTESELQAACQPAYRDMLQLKLTALRAQLAELE